MMRYSEKIIPAEFVSRPNRFIAEVLVNGIPERVHVKNTGRCRELLIPGSTVYLACPENPERKTKYDLIAVQKKRSGKTPLLINMDSQIPNSAVEEWLPRSGLFSPSAVIRREVKYGNSRFDFQIMDGPRKCFLEVKGVTLEHDGCAMFPDAPTERGVKHLEELINASGNGWETFVLFVIQMKEIQIFRPNDQTDPAFGNALRRAAAHGVKILAFDCNVTPDSMTVDSAVPVDIKGDIK